MKKYFLLLPLALLLFLFSSCKDQDKPKDWLIPLAEIFDGGPGKDGIPAIDDPKFKTVEEMEKELDADDLVVGLKVGDVVRAYPHTVLDWHEIVNDNIGGRGVAVTYCPLTGTAIGWDANVNGKNTTFGVSGLLYNSNLIPYDRNTDSNWSQMGLQCVNGELSGDTPKLISLIETNWKTWKSMYPDSEVLSSATGFARSYGNYPYGDYKESDRLLFSVGIEDNRLDKKERVLGVFGGSATKTYRFSSFDYNQDTTGRAIIMDEVGGESVLLVASETENIIVAFKAKQGAAYTILAAEGEGLFKDADGNIYNIFGENISGGGADLQPQASFIGYWFSWGVFYPGIPIYEK